MSRWSPFLSPGLPSYPTASDLAQGMERPCLKHPLGPRQGWQEADGEGSRRVRTRPPGKFLYFSRVRMPCGSTAGSRMSPASGV